MVSIVPIEAYYTFERGNIQQLLAFGVDDCRDLTRITININGKRWEPGLFALRVTFSPHGHPIGNHYWNEQFCVIYRDYCDEDQRKVAWAKEKNLSLLAFGLCNVIDEEHDTDRFNAVYLFKTTADALLFKLRWNV